MNTRNGLRGLARVCILGFLGLVLASCLGAEVGEPPVLITDGATDRSTAYQMQNKLVRFDAGGREYLAVAYSENRGGDRFRPWNTMRTRVATYDTVEGRVIEDIEIGTQFDNHGSPCLTIDPDGYLHIVYGPHHHPVKYRRSLHPYDATEWTEEERVSFLYGDIGDRGIDAAWSTIHGEATYPIVKVDREGTVHLAVSLSYAVGYIRKRDGAWEKPRKLFSADRKYSRYDVMMNIDGEGRVHVLAPDLDLRKNPQGVYRGVLDYYHLISEDGGDSFSRPRPVWTTADGYGQGGGNVAIDDEGRIHFMVIERDWESRKRAWVVAEEGSSRRVVELAVPDRYIWQGAITLADDGTTLAVVQANESLTDWRDPSNRLYLFVIPAESGDPLIYPIDTPESIPSPWLPTLERNSLWTTESTESRFIAYIDDDPNQENNLSNTYRMNLYLQELLLPEAVGR